MSLDGIALSGVRREIEECLVGGRLQKVHQPGPLEICLLFYRGSRQRLRVSAHPARPGIYLSREATEHPEYPPPFCQVLRKHLEGASLLSISQVEPLERVLHLEFEASDTSGGGKRTLVVELMGKHSNIVLLGEDGVVVDAVRRITPFMSRHRQVFPGSEYVPPPIQHKRDPRFLTEEDLGDAWSKEREPAKALVSLVAGVGPCTAREAFFRCGTDTSCLADTLREMALSVGKGSSRPTMIWGPDDRIIGFAPFHLHHLGALRKREFESLNDLLDTYYSASLRQQGLQERRNRARKVAKSALERAQRRLANLQGDLAEAKRAPEYRRLGELLMAYLHQIPAGCEALVDDYTTPDMRKVSIPMDPRLSPLENAREYFRRHSKAKKGLDVIKIQMEKAGREVAYLEQSLLCVEQVTSVEEIDEILEELEEEGYLGRAERKKRKVRKPRQTSGDVPCYLSSEGLPIYVGKNNRQNDFITMRLASPDDVWLHAKNIPGSHVLIKSGENPISGQDLEEAALLAAYHSKARQGSQVPVDYTLRKDVWKPRGAKPGMVLYRNHRTVYVTPEEEKAVEIMGRPAPGFEV